MFVRLLKLTVNLTMYNNMTYQFNKKTYHYISIMRNTARQPIVNYTHPDITLETPSYVAPSYKNNSINCTSNQIGNYTYTNCY